MGDSGGLASMVRDSLVIPTHGGSGDGREECDCERRCSNPKHAHDCRNTDYAVSPVMERRNKGVLGRLRNFASRTSYSTSEDGHSHSSDYEDMEEEKRADPRFCREARERSSTSWAGRVRDLHRDVKKKISKLRNSKGIHQDEEMVEGLENVNGGLQRGSSVESIPSGSGSSLQPPTPTSSNRSSTSVGEDDHNAFVGTFIGRARALVDCTPSPYDRDGLAFKKGDIIDIIAKHKTGLWVGMAQGKVGHFKFINVEEAEEEKRVRHRKRRLKSEWMYSSKKPETLEDLLKQLDLEDYTNVLVLNGYDELNTFKEIEKTDLETLGIVNPDHCSKLLKAVEMLQDVDPDGEGADEDEPQLKPSPRDSGCYASHENLAHQDPSTRALGNGQFVVDLEDQDTSHSESGFHSREGQDVAAAMNNLDLSASSKSTDTAPPEDAIPHEGPDHVDSSSHYNILPTREDTSPKESNQPPPIPTFEVIIPKQDSPSSLTVPFFVSGTKSSPGSPRKVRSKHHQRNKSHSHRHKDLASDFGLSLPSGRCRELPADRNGFVYGWAAFSGKSSGRKKVHEYDDVVSDPATEVEDSPGRHVYRKVKQRKGSLQTLIHDARPPSPTLIAKVNKKLGAEKIYLHEEPYTDKTGFCGIPPALVQRYAEELQHSIVDVADALDQSRITTLQQQGRRGVPNDFLSDSCIVPVIEPNYSSLRSWLTSLGLPMYLEQFQSSGIEELHQLTFLNRDDLLRLQIRDPFHRIYVESAIGALLMRFQCRPSTYSQGHSLA